jgi:hypothetical protein
MKELFIAQLLTAQKTTQHPTLNTQNKKQPGTLFLTLHQSSSK